MCRRQKKGDLAAPWLFLSLRPPAQQAGEVGQRTELDCATLAAISGSAAALPASPCEEMKLENRKKAHFDRAVRNAMQRRCQGAMQGSVVQKQYKSVVS